MASVQQSVSSSPTKMAHMPKGSNSSTSVPASLSREVLRWIQSLDLAYSVKNVKRDFSNGFLIAEIFSRYYDKEVQMHSYDNGIALRIKKDNWGQLIKFMRKVGLHELTSQEEINAIIHCEDGAVVGFLNRFYEVLTHRKVQQVTRRPLPDATPAYAKATGSAVMRQAMERSASLRETSDEHVKKRFAEHTFVEHERSLQEERSIDPERFSSGVSQHSSRHHAETRAVTSERAAVPQVTVKDISVKQVDRNISQLRATQDLSNRNAQYGGAVPLLGSQAQQYMPPAVPPDSDHGGVACSSVAEVMQECVVKHLSEWAELEDAPSAFISGVLSGEVSSEVAGQVMASVVHQASTTLPRACLGSPQAFHATVSWLVNMVTDWAQPQEGEGGDRVCYTMAVQALHSLADSMVSVDAGATSALFSDLALPKLIPVIRLHSGKREDALALVFAFCEDSVSAHLQALKRLHELVNDQTVFLKAVTRLVHMESSFDANSEDKYMYYHTMGLGHPSPSIRAASVAMLASLLPRLAPTEALARLRAVGDLTVEQERWWECRAALLAACGAGLGMGGDVGILAEQLARSVMHPSCGSVHPHVKAWSVMALAPHMETPSAPHLTAEILRTLLLELPARDVADLMGVSEASTPAQHAHASGAVGRLARARSRRRVAATTPVLGAGRLCAVNALEGVNALPLARELVAYVQGLNNLELAHMQVLAGCVRSRCEAGELSQEWIEVFESMRDLVLVALCDPECCHLSAMVVESFAFHSQLREGIVREKNLAGVLHLLYPTGGAESDPRCQEVAVKMLRRLVNEGQGFRDSVRALLSQLDLPEASAMRTLYTEL